MSGLTAVTIELPKVVGAFLLRVMRELMKNTEVSSNRIRFSCSSRFIFQVSVEFLLAFVSQRPSQNGLCRSCCNEMFIKKLLTEL